MFATVLLTGNHVNALWTAPAILILGAGMGACISSISDVAIGDVAPAAGSASGSLSAAQQLAAAIGSAIVTTVYLSQTANHGGTYALTISMVVAGIIAHCPGPSGFSPKPPRTNSTESFAQSPRLRPRDLHPHL